MIASGVYGPLIGGPERFDGLGETVSSGLASSELCLNGVRRLLWARNAWARLNIFGQTACESSH